MTKQILGAFVGTLAAGAVIIGVTKLLGPIPLSISQTTTNKQSTFDVSGTGEVTTAPDQAEISLGYQTTSTTVADAQNKGNQVINTITKDVQSLGINSADIKTVSYSLYPSYDFSAGQHISGYNLNISLDVKVKDFDKVNQVIDVATKDGANQVGGISFTISDAKEKDIENQARKQAIDEAKNKAQSTAQLAGIRLGKIVNVTEDTAQAPRPVPLLAKDMAVNAAGTAAPTQVNPGSTT
ncbi:hypothetical protein C5B42_04775, partial [Candidatus Cerribacteria bacterium 'Amazon FNV 2010 28 9']